MHRRWVVIVLLAATVVTAFGDSIDEAEAKRRGVPVSQVQAENALAAEKRKTAQLEQQIAAIKKKIDELRPGTNGPSATSASPTASAPAVPQASGKAVASMPAIPETVPAGVTRADDMLAKFPANVPPKGTKVIVQGRYVNQQNGAALPRVRNPDGSSVQTYVKHLYVMGTNQDPFNPVHLTCQIESDGKLSGVQYDTVIRIGGTIGETDIATGKVELTQCDSVEVVPLPPKTLDAQVVGDWWARYPAPASLRGEFQFRSDRTMTATFFNPQGGVITLPGKWQTKPNEENKISLVLQETNGPVDLELLQGILRVPSILPLYYFPDPNARAEFRQHEGPPIKASLAQAQNQVVQWVRTNCVPAQQTTALNAATKLFEEAAPRKGNFSLTLDGQLTRSQKMTELCVSQDELFVFEYSDAQAKASGVAAGATRGIARGESFTVSDSTIRIESLTLDDADPLDATARIKGKVVIRAITRGGIGGVKLCVSYGNNREEMGFNAGLDNATVEFSFQPPTRVANDEIAKKRYGNQVVMSFFVCGHPLERQSNIIARLVDMKY